MPKSAPRLGKMQYRILQYLWENGPATARDITEALSKDAPIAHSTIQTLLRQLESKGSVAHETVERTFIFRAIHQPSDVRETPLQDLLTRVYQGSVYNLMSHLLRHETISDEEMERLRALIEEERKR